MMIITAVEATNSVMMALFSAATAATEKSRAGADQFCQAWVGFRPRRGPDDGYVLCQQATVDR